MSNDNEIRQRFAQMLEKDKRRKRRSQYILLAIHAGVFIVAVFLTLHFSAYTDFQGELTNNLGWFGLLAAGVIGLIAHVYAVFSANNSTVQDTVFESLMLLMAHREATPSTEGKAKRAISDEAYRLSDDCELIPSTKDKSRNGYS